MNICNTGNITEDKLKRYSEQILTQKGYVIQNSLLFRKLSYNLNERCETAEIFRYLKIGSIVKVGCSN